MKNYIQTLGLISAISVMGASAHADYYYGPQLRQETAQLVAQSEFLSRSVLTGQNGAPQEAILLWGATLAFQAMMEREANFAGSLPAVQYALDTVAYQHIRAENVIRNTSDYYRLQNSLNQIAQEISQVRFYLKPAPAPTTISFTRCNVGGNFMKPDLTVYGSIRGIGIRRATVYYRGAVVGDLSAINDYYAGRPNDRTIEATILLQEKFRKGGTNGAPGAPNTCRIEVIDEMNQVTNAEISAT